MLQSSNNVLTKNTYLAILLVNNEGENMKRLESVESDQVQLEVIECDCGYHMGIDATYLDQVGDFVTDCPSCHLRIDTAEVCPE